MKKITVKAFKEGAVLEKPIYSDKPYVIKSMEDVILFAGTLQEIKSNLIVFSSYYDDCIIAPRKHDLYMSNNERNAGDEMLEPMRVVVVVEGGIVQAAFSNDQNITVEILDQDNWKDAECGDQEAAYYKSLQAALHLMDQVY